MIDSPFALAAKVYKIEGVQAFYFKAVTDSLTHLWTLVERDEYELREKIYEAETQMYTEYPDQHISSEHANVWMERLQQAHHLQVVFLPMVCKPARPRPPKLGR